MVIAAVVDRISGRDGTGGDCGRKIGVVVIAVT